jgi:hypothetical protein
MRFAILTVAALLSLCGLGGRAEARNVFLNGIKLDANVAMKPQTLSGCEVRIDDKGDIHITARGYKVMAPEGKPTAPGPVVNGAPLAGDRRFWLISKFDVERGRGAAGFDVDVFINDTFVKKIRASDDPLVLDVSRHLERGDNKVTMVATKNPPTGSSSRSPTDTLEIILGEGVAGGGTVTIDKVHAAFKRNASETGNLREDFTVTVR